MVVIVAIDGVTNLFRVAWIWVTCPALFGNQWLPGKWCGFRLEAAKEVLDDVNDVAHVFVEVLKYSFVLRQFTLQNIKL